MNIIGPLDHYGNTGLELTIRERGANVVTEIIDEFEAATKKAHGEYGVDPELDRINLSMEDGPDVGQTRLRIDITRCMTDQSPQYSMYWHEARAEELEISDNWNRCIIERGPSIIETALDRLRRGEEQGLILGEHVNPAAVELLRALHKAFNL